MDLIPERAEPILVLLPGEGLYHAQVAAAALQDERLEVLDEALELVTALLLEALNEIGDDREKDLEVEVVRLREAALGLVVDLIEDR